MKLPKYPKISLDKLPKGAICIFYGGNKLTEWVGKHLYKFPYEPAPYHASVYIKGPKQMHLNVGLKATIYPLSEEFITKERIDVIVYPKLSTKDRGKIVERSLEDLGKWYDVKGFLGFGRKIPIAGFLIDKLLKGRKRLPFCSDNVQDAYREIGVKVANTKDEETAPWDLITYAEKHPKQCQLYTLWLGNKFPY